MHENTGPDSSRVKFWTNRNEFVGYLERVFRGFVGKRGSGQFHLRAWTKKARKAKCEQSGKAGNKCGNTAETRFIKVKFTPPYTCKDSVNGLLVNFTP